MIDINLDIDSFKLKGEYFYNLSLRHGINHTYRVMCLCLYLGDKLNNISDTRQAVCAAFIHDMSRRHDGYCTDHGSWSVREKLPHFRKMFISLGLSAQELKSIELAVENHCMGKEVDPGHPHYNVVAILKDADALDRVRLGDWNLNTDFLRFKESLDLIDFSMQLYQNTKDISIENFKQVLDLAKNLK